MNSAKRSFVARAVPFVVAALAIFALWRLFAGRADDAAGVLMSSGTLPAYVPAATRPAAENVPTQHPYARGSACGCF